MTQLKLTPHRTEPLAPEQARQIAQSHSGQAHFAGTGPKGKTCRECEHWAPFKVAYYSFKGKHKGKLKDAPCGKFKSLTGRYGDDVPHDARSCRHFEPTDNPPAIVDPKI